MESLIWHHPRRTAPTTQGRAVGGGSLWSLALHGLQSIFGGWGGWLSIRLCGLVRHRSGK